MLIFRYIGTNVINIYNLYAIVEAWITMESVPNVTNNESNFNMKDIIDIWSTEKHCPLLYVSQAPDTYNETIISYANAPDPSLTDSKQYQIYVTYTTKSIMNFDIESHTKNSIWLSSLTPRYHIHGIDNNDWIIINLQQAGKC